MKHLQILIGLTILFIFSGCTSYYAVYDISLKEAITPEKVKEKYGAQKISKTDSLGVTKYYFENDMVKILWLTTSSQVNFSITNKTDYSIKIIWDEAAYVDENGISHRVMHAGIRYTDRGNPQPPTVIPRKGMITDMMLPTDNVYYASDAGWVETPLFMNSAQTSDKLREVTKKNIGKTFQVLLPLQIQDVTNEYTFTFEIQHIKFNE